MDVDDSRILGIALALIERQRRLADSDDFLERAKTLWVAAELDKRLSRCTDAQIAELLLKAEERLPIFEAEFAVIEHARRRLSKSRQLSLSLESDDWEAVRDEGVKNAEVIMTKIWERLFLGSFKDAQQLTASNPCGITAVVSLCEDAARRAADISYVHLPISDSRPIPAQKFEAVMEAIASGVRRGILLVHCLGGSSRSPIMVAAWMHRCGYAGIDKALAEVSELRDIDPSPVLFKSVREALIR